MTRSVFIISNLYLPLSLSLYIYIYIYMHFYIFLYTSSQASRHTHIRICIHARVRMRVRAHAGAGALSGRLAAVLARAGQGWPENSQATQDKHIIRKPVKSVTIDKPHRTYVAAAKGLATRLIRSVFIISNRTIAN